MVLYLTLTFKIKLNTSKRHDEMYLITRGLALKINSFSDAAPNETGSKRAISIFYLDLGNNCVRNLALQYQLNSYLNFQLIVNYEINMN